MKTLQSQFINTLGTSVGLLGINFVTGVLIARLLNPAGRGELAAIGTWAQIVGWASALGFSEAVTYLQSKKPEDGPRILGTSLVVAALFGSIGILIVELLLPYAFSAQSSEVRTLSRFFMITIYMSVAGGSFNALIAGSQDFHFLNFMRLMQPGLYAMSIIALWIGHDLTVTNVLLVSGGTGFVSLSLTFHRLISSIGLGKPSLSIFKDGFFYGLKLQGSLFSALASGRLDIMLMPALLAPAQIGLYSVSTNISALVTSVLGSLSLIVFPAAARMGQQDGLVLVAKTLRLVILIGGIFAAILYSLAPFLLGTVYGAKYDGAILSLRVLLPGVVLMAATGIINSGLQAVDQPSKASYAQAAGLFVTLLGLTMTLKPFGILGAALTSTASYTVSFLVALYFLGQEQGFAVKQETSFHAFAYDIQIVLIKICHRFSWGGVQ